jgi:hypothetical protein
MLRIDPPLLIKIFFSIDPRLLQEARDLGISRKKPKNLFPPASCLLPPAFY